MMTCKHKTQRWWVSWASKGSLGPSTCCALLLSKRVKVLRVGWALAGVCSFGLGSAIETCDGRSSAPLEALGLT